MCDLPRFPITELIHWPGWLKFASMAFASMRYLTAKEFLLHNLHKRMYFLFLYECAKIHSPYFYGSCFTVMLCNIWSESVLWWAERGWVGRTFFKIFRQKIFLSIRKSTAMFVHNIAFCLIYSPQILLDYILFWVLRKQFITDMIPCGYGKLFRKLCEHTFDAFEIVFVFILSFFLNILELSMSYVVVKVCINDNKSETSPEFCFLWRCEITSILHFLHPHASKIRWHYFFRKKYFRSSYFEQETSWKFNTITDTRIWCCFLVKVRYQILCNLDAFSADFIAGSAENIAKNGSVSRLSRKSLETVELKQNKRPSFPSNWVTESLTFSIFFKLGMVSFLWINLCFKTPWRLFFAFSAWLEPKLCVKWRWQARFLNPKMLSWTWEFTS